ncbi:unnamed protein product, partial [Mesorhabditis belari]|uniref:Suppressor of cytokine signaling 7 n=1 Tax=Mesorhabditis belari TaxID=2138241 RepID=A0AAF3F0P0_9BILA
MDDQQPSTSNESPKTFRNLPTNGNRYMENPHFHETDQGTPRGTDCFSEHIKILKRCPWYWGDITWSEAESLLLPCPEGTYLLRDSRNDSHIFTVSWRSREKVLHSRSLLYWNAKSGPDITKILEKAIRESQSGEANLLMHRRGEADQAELCTITMPLSRFDLFPQSLSYLCRLELRLTHDVVSLSRARHVPPRILDYLLEPRFLAPPIEYCVEQIKKRYRAEIDL